MINSSFAATGTLDTIVHSMLDKSRKKLIMASIKSNALVAWAMANERTEIEDGGANITNPLTVGRNSNIASYQYFDELPINQTNEFTTVGYGWSRVAGTMIISDQEADAITAWLQGHRDQRLFVPSDFLAVHVERRLAPMPLHSFS